MFEVYPAHLSREEIRRELADLGQIHVDDALAHLTVPASPTRAATTSGPAAPRPKVTSSAQDRVCVTGMIALLIATMFAALFPSLPIALGFLVIAEVANLVLARYRR